MSVEFLNPVASAAVETAHGRFTADVFTVGGRETVVLHTDNVPGKVDNVLCRIQSECVSHAFFDLSCDCAEQMSSSLCRIREAGTGLVIYLRQEGMGLGLAGKLARDWRDWRSYYPAVEILKYYGVRSVELISLNRRKIEALSQGGIDVRCSAWHEGRTIILGDRIERTVEQVRTRQALRPIEDGAGTPRVLILGDLNIDSTEPEKANAKDAPKETSVAGTAYNVAVALKNTGKFTPIIFGKVGRDENGSRVRRAIRDEGIYGLLGIHDEKLTGFVKITPTGDPAAPFHYNWDKENNANDYDIRNLRQAIELAGISADDYVFVSSYLFVQKFFVTREINEVMRAVSATGARVVLDIVRKSLSIDVLRDCKVGGFDKSQLQDCLSGVSLHAVVSDIGTFDSLGIAHGLGSPGQSAMQDLYKFFSAPNVVCRYKEFGALHQRVGLLHGDGMVVINDEQSPDPQESRVGLGDEMFAGALELIRRHERNNRGE